MSIITMENPVLWKYTGSQDFRVTGIQVWILDTEFKSLKSSLGKLNKCLYHNFFFRKFRIKCFLPPWYVVRIKWDNVWIYGAFYQHRYSKIFIEHKCICMYTYQMLVFGQITQIWCLSKKNEDNNGIFTTELLWALSNLIYTYIIYLEKHLTTVCA